MPSALEKLVKILKLEQNTGCQDKAVQGGLAAFGAHWQPEAHTQAKKPEHHALVDELVGLLSRYDLIDDPIERSLLIRHMLDRITGRIPPLATTPPQATPVQSDPSPPRTVAPPRPIAPPSPPRSREVPREPVASHPAPVQGRTDGGEGTPRPASRPPLPRPVTPADSSPVRQERRPRQESIPQTIDDLEMAPIALPAESAPPPIFRPPRRHPDNRPVAEQMASWDALHAPVTALNGIGPKLAEKLAAVPITTVGEALYAFPRRYDDYTAMPPLNKLRFGELVSVLGTVMSVVEIKGRRGTDALRVVIDDGSGSKLSVSFFNQSYLRGKIQRGDQVVFSGKIDEFLGKPVMNNPAWEFIDQDALKTRAIVPVYPLVAGLTPNVMRRVTEAALLAWGDRLADPVPGTMLDRVRLPDLAWTLRQIHRPDSLDAVQLARRRLTFDTLLLMQLAVLRNRRAWQRVPADPLPISDDRLTAFKQILPYALTGAQAREVEAIRADLAKPIPMNRLLQGDVGSGKTAVAAVAMTIAAINGHQSALMAPTEILAEQHYRTLSRLFSTTPIVVRLLTGSTSSAERNETLAGLAAGQVHIVIGTHALIEDTVQFAALGLAIIDEQHRFGVEQRSRLRGKGNNPHLLVMTATPIPRTLALTLYADLDLSVLDEMPPGRSPIETRICLPVDRESAYDDVRRAVQQGRQAFIIYPLVEASESEGLAHVRSATEEFERLRVEIFPEYRVGLLHGRLSSADKDAAMSAFSRGEFDILIATSVVEVGIDVPNATVIVIEGANRFGLAQLHQFRGRVGRGAYAGTCILIPDDGADDDQPRLQAMVETSDGFRLAEIDWRLRGAGDLLGTQQSGTVGELAEYMTMDLVAASQQEARVLYAEDPTFDAPEHLLLRSRLIALYGSDPGAELS